MKICVCDFCKKDGKLVEATRVARVRKHSMYNLEYCDKCASKVPEAVEGIIRTSYALQGITLKQSDAEIRKQFLSGEGITLN